MATIHGLAPRASDAAHGLVVVRFSQVLSGATQRRALQRLIDAGAISGDFDPELYDGDSRYLAGPFDPPGDEGVEVIRRAIDALEFECGADTAWFFTVGTEVDALAAGASMEEPSEEDAGEPRSFWKNGPPDVSGVSIQIDDQERAVESFDGEDFGVSLKLAGKPLPGERNLLHAFAAFWLAPYVDANAREAYSEGELPAPYQDSGLAWDVRHRSAMLWVEGFAPPVMPSELAAHLRWVVGCIDAVVQVACARFGGATQEQKRSGDEAFVLAGNPLRGVFAKDGLEAALAWASAPSGRWSKAEAAAMLVEVAMGLDPSDPDEAADALRLFDGAADLEPNDVVLQSHALMALVLMDRVDEAVARATRAGSPELACQLLELLCENAPESLESARALFRPDVLDRAHGSFLTGLVQAIGAGAPELIDALFEALPKTEAVVSHVYTGVTQLPGPELQLPVLLRAVELPCADDGPHRQNWLAALNALCVVAHAVKDYQLAAKVSDRAAPFGDENPYIHHSVACAYAAVGAYEKAFHHVERAVDTDYELLERVEVDTDLGPLLEWPRFKALFARWRDERAKAEPVLQATDGDFEQLVLRHDKPVLVDFTASWCAPCRRLAPVVAQLAAESRGRYRVVQIDIDENQATPARFEVSSYPTLIAFAKGEPTGRHVGFTDKATLKKLVAQSGS